MRYLFIIATLALWPVNVLKAQSQQDNEAVFQLVTKYLNAQNTDSMYALTGEAFRAKINKETFSGIAENNLYALGKVGDTKLLSYQSGTSTYLMHCAAMDVEMHFNLDEKGKLRMFFFKPHKDNTEQKTSLAAHNNPLHTSLDVAVHKAAGAYIQQLHTVGLSIGVIQNDTMHFYDYGETALGNKTLPNANTLFEIGSISKTFTATLLAYYVTFNKVNLNDPITKYLPDSLSGNKDLQQITLLMLANHTSGLPRLPDNLEDYLKDSTNPYKFYTQEALYSYLKTYKAKAGAVAGKAYNYSNTGAGLLGHILEKASGQTYNNMLRTLITEPLRMEHTFISIPKAESRNIAHVYTEKGSETPIWTMGSMQGAGAIKSTLPNMLLYAKAQLHCTNGTLENALRLTHIITYSNDLNVGLAWHQMKLKGTDIFWHNGGTYGSSSYIAFVPSKNLALVVLANSATSVDDLAIELLKLLNN